MQPCWLLFLLLAQKPERLVFPCFLSLATTNTSYQLTVTEFAEQTFVSSQRQCFQNKMSTLRRVIIATKKAPDAIGPYNQVLLKHFMLLLWILINHFQAVQVDSTLYISGQIGFIPSTMQVRVKQLNKNVTNLDSKTRVSQTWNLSRPSRPAVV